MILCREMRSWLSAMLRTVKMRGVRRDPPVKVMKMRSSLNFSFQFIPPLIIRVLPKRVEAWCFMFSPPLARAHSLRQRLKTSSQVLKRFPFSPSKLTPPTITTLPRQISTVWKQGETLGPSPALRTCVHFLPYWSYLWKRESPSKPRWWKPPRRQTCLSAANRVALQRRAGKRESKQRLGSGNNRKLLSTICQSRSTGGASILCQRCSQIFLSLVTLRWRCPLRLACASDLRYSLKDPLSLPWLRTRVSWSCCRCICSLATMCGSSFRQAWKDSGWVGRLIPLKRPTEAVSLRNFSTAQSGLPVVRRVC